MQPTVSVIIPFYNAENTITRTLDSVQQQTLNDFECLLIDDGSTDNSAIICNQYAKRDKRFKVFHKINGGVSSAREFGLCQAKGEYIIHMDSDDWVENDMLEGLCAMAIADSSDMVICDFVDEWEDKSIVNKQSPSSLENSVIIREMFTKLHGSCCNKLVKRELFNRYDIHFPTGLNICEDLFVNISILVHNVKVSYLPVAYYHYEHTSNSSSLINTSRDWSLVYQSLIGHFKILLADRYPDILDYLRLLAKRECFINGMSYSEFVYTCPEINRNLINLINQYCNEKSLKFACHNRITYYIALVVKRITRLFSSRLCIGINQKMLDKRIR